MSPGGSREICLHTSAEAGRSVPSSAQSRSQNTLMDLSPPAALIRATQTHAKARLTRPPGAVYPRGMVDSEGGRGRGNTRTQASFAKVFLSLLMGATAVMGFSNPASACAWDNETYLAEAKSLPCVLDVLVGRYPKHTREYFDARIRAADAALSWVPLWTAPLDTKGVALMRLGRFSEARTVMDRRAEADPEAYASHANLGTLLTFTGSYEAALKHVDKALAVEPDAHFGRERYHRLLLVFLQRVAADSNASMEGDFLGPDLTSEQLFQGSEKRFRDGGGDESVFDALVAMIAVYGADEVSHVYFALANQLALSLIHI